MKMCIASFLQQQPCFFDVDGSKVLLYGSNGKVMHFTLARSIDNKTFWLKDDVGKDFVLYHISGNLHQCIDCKNQCVSGLPKERRKLNECLGCWIDRPTNSVCFRIAKNGSSQIAKAYSTFGFAFDPSTDNKFVKLEEVDIASIEGMVKYFVWRDPMNRVLSQINHFIHKQNITAYYRKYKAFNEHLLKSIDSIARFVLVNYRTMQHLEDYIPQLENDVHLLQQSSFLKRFSRIPFTCVVQLKDLPAFMQNVLHKENTNYSICGYNTNVTAAPNQLMSEFKQLFTADEATIAQYKEIIYKP